MNQSTWLGNCNLMKNIVIRSTDSSLSQLYKNGIVINHNGKIINVNANIKDTMKEIKLRCSVSGLSGADCIICISKTEGWTDPDL